MLLSPDTWIGTKLCIVDPFPSCPSSFKPHDHTVPSERRANECSWPAETAIIFVKPPTIMGVKLAFVLLFPSCPLSLRPHPQTIPFDIAKPYRSPALICVTFVNPETRMKLELVFVVPFPSWPLRFHPDVQIVPLLIKSMLCHAPAEMLIMLVTLGMRTGE